MQKNITLTCRPSQKLLSPEENEILKGHRSFNRRTHQLCRPICAARPATHDCRRHCSDVVYPWLMPQVCILLCAERRWQDKGSLLSASRVSWSGQHPLDMPTTPRLTRDSTQHHSAPPISLLTQGPGAKPLSQTHKTVSFISESNLYTRNFVLEVPRAALMMCGILCLAGR